MDKSADIFSSKTRVRILRTLFYQQRMPLRHIAYFVGGAVYAVQYALKKLVTEKIVLHVYDKKHILYRLNKTHRAYPFIQHVFEGELHMEINSRSRLYNIKASSIISFCDSSRKLLSQARGRI
jgi:hypothetical protein